MTSYVKDLGQQRFMASFVPHYAMKHVIEMKFNDEDVPGQCCSGAAVGSLGWLS